MWHSQNANKHVLRCSCHYNMIKRINQSSKMQDNKLRFSTHLSTEICFKGPNFEHSSWTSSLMSRSKSGSVCRRKIWILKSNLKNDHRDVMVDVADLQAGIKHVFEEETFTGDANWINSCHCRAATSASWDE